MSIKISSTGFWDSKEAHMNHGYSIPLVKWISEYLKEDKNKQLYDFGCGIGHYLQQFEQLGFTKLIGFEGDPPVHKVFSNIKQQDLTKQFSVEEKGNCIFLEVAEHIPANLEDVTLNNVVDACNGKLITSWAVRGQGGHGHINCLDNHEAIERFTRRGMKYLKEDTESARSVIDGTKCDWQPGVLGAELPWFKNTLFVFEK